MSKPGEPYRPSSPTELVMFQDYFCTRCVKDNKWRDGEHTNPSCRILEALVFYGKDNCNYPEELTYNDTGHPTCTAFVHEDKASDIAESEKRKPREADVCVWTYCWGVDRFETSCGNTHRFLLGGARYNSFETCPFKDCGRPISEKEGGDESI